MKKTKKHNTKIINSYALVNSLKQNHTLINKQTNIFRLVIKETEEDRKRERSELLDFLYFIFNLNSVLVKKKKKE